MAGNEDKPRLPQRRGRKAPGDLPDGFEPIVPLFRRSKPLAARPAPTASTPPRPLPRAVAPASPAAPVQARPAPERPVIAEPAAQHKTRPGVLPVAIAAALLVLILVAIVLWATG